MTILSQLQGIAAFVHTVETGSFTAAAARMGLSKSTTGKGVARLESRLGVRLLNRTTRNLSLTTEGQDYYRSCVAILEELGAAEGRLGSGRDSLSGTVRINLPISFGRLHCMPIITALTVGHPALRLDVTFADRRVDLAEEGIDLVVRLGHPGDQSSLTGRRVAWQPGGSPGSVPSSARVRPILNVTADPGPSLISRNMTVSPLHAMAAPSRGRLSATMRPCTH